MALIQPTFPSAVRVANLRGLIDTGYVEIRPLTVLVGANGSGKSSFLRFFPLLRQSVENRIRGPLLWVDGLVDYGSFSDAVRRGQHEVTYGFDTGRSKVEVAIRLSGQSAVIAAERLWGWGSDPLEMEFSLDGRLTHLTAGERDFAAVYPDYYKGHLRRVDGRSVFPYFSVSDYGAPEPWSDESASPAREEIRGALVHVVRDEQNLEQLMTRLFRRSRLAPDMEAELSSFFSTEGIEDGASGGVEWSTGTDVSRLEADLRAFFREDPSARVVRALMDLVREIDEGQLEQTHRSLRECFSRIAYLGPSRGRPERYYRYSDLAVDMLDPDARNLAMVLLSWRERGCMEAFNDWLRTTCGFQVLVQPAGPQVEIRVVLEAADFNIVDVGYGYAEVLPVLVQIWALENPRLGRPEKLPLSLFCVEQPELHLHPRMQTLLGRAFASVARARTTPVIVETHSEALIAELAEQVATEKLDPSLVSILCFEPAEGGSTVRVATFREDRSGRLDNWPIGFFSATP